MHSATKSVSSELQLQGELNLPRRSKVARREACGSDLSETAIANRQVRVTEIRVIEQVEQLRAELQIDPFRKLRVLDG